MSSPRRAAMDELSQNTKGGRCNVLTQLSWTSWTASPYNLAHFNAWRESIYHYKVVYNEAAIFCTYSQRTRRNDQASLEKAFLKLTALELEYSFKDECRVSPWFFSSADAMTRHTEKAERSYSDCPLVGLPFASDSRGSH